MITADDETKEMPVVVTADDAGHDLIKRLEARVADVEQQSTAQNKAHIKYSEKAKAIIAELESELAKTRLLPKDATPAQIANAFGGSVARMATKIQNLQTTIKVMQENDRLLNQNYELLRERTIKAEANVEELEARIKTDLEG